MRENVCMQGVILRRQESKERSDGVQSVKSFHNFIIKSEFGFGNHII